MFLKLRRTIKHDPSRALRFKHVDVRYLYMICSHVSYVTIIVSSYDRDHDYVSTVTVPLEVIQRQYARHIAQYQRHPRTERVSHDTIMIVHRRDDDYYMRRVVARIARVAQTLTT